MDIRRTDVAGRCGGGVELGRAHRGRAVRCGSGLVAVIAVLAALTLVIAAVVMSGGRDGRLSVLRAQGVWAEYAAESAASLAVKELIDGVDHDGDGVIGSVSDDGVAANDPQLNATRMWATREDVDGEIVITAFGENQAARRSVRVRVVPGSEDGIGAWTGDRIFHSRSSPRSMRYAAFDGGTLSWGATSLSGSTPNEPIAVAAAWVGDSVVVMASHSGNGLYAGVADASGVASYASVCSDIGFKETRAFDAAPFGDSGDGMLVYYHKNSNRARYRTVSGGLISSETNVGIPTTSDIPWMKLVPMNDGELMLLTTHTSKHVWGARWTGSAWTDVTQLTTSFSDSNYDGAAAAVESVSGRVVMAFAHSTSGRIGYRVFTPGSGWSSVSQLTGFGSQVYWVRMTPVPGTNQVFLATQNTNDQVHVARWDGSSWSAPTQIESNVGSSSRRGFDIAASPDGSSVIVMYTSPPAVVVRWRRWTGSGWTGQSPAFPIPSGGPRIVQLRPGPAGNILVGAVSDGNGGLNTFAYDGAAFVNVDRIGTTSSSFSDEEWFAIPLSPGGGGGGSPRITEWAAVEP